MSPLGTLTASLETAFLDALPDLFIVLDTNGHITTLNKSAVDASPHTHDELLGAPLTDTHAHLLGSQWHTISHDASHSNQPRAYETFNATLGAWHHITLTPTADGLIILIRDVTEHKHTQHLQRLTETLTRTGAPEHVADVMLAEAAQATGAYMAALFHLTEDGQHLRLTHHLHYPPELQARLAHFPLTLGIPISDAAVRGSPVFVGENFDERYPESIGVRSALTRSLAALPLITDGELRAVLAVSFQEPRPFHDAERAYLQALTQHCAQALERARLALEERQTRQQAERSEERFRTLVETIAHIVWTRSPDGDFTEDQPQWRIFTGQSTQELLGRGWLNAIHPNDRERVRDQWNASVATATPYLTEYRLRHQTGVYRHVRVRATPILGADQSVREWVGIHEDITERTLAEHLATGQAELLERLLAGGDLPSLLHDITRWVETVQPDMLCSVLLLDDHKKHLLHGAAPSLPAAYNDAIHGVEIGPNVGSCGTAAYLGEPVYVTDVLTDDRWVNFRELATTHGLRACWSTPLRGRDGEVLGTYAQYYREPRSPSPEELTVIATAAHLTSLAIERTRGEQALKANEARLSGILSTVSDAIVTTDADQRIVLFNRAAERIFGVEASVVLGTSLHRFIPNASRERHAEHLRNFASTNQSTRAMNNRGALPAVRADGTEFPVEATISQVTVGEQRLFTAVLRDVSDLKQAEQAVRDSEARFRATFDQAAVGIAHVALDGRWMLLNERYCDILGYGRDELLNLTFQDITHPDDLDLDLEYVHQLLRGERNSYSMHKRYIRKDGAPVWVNLTVSLVKHPDGTPHYFIAAVEDIEHVKQVEVELRRAREDLELRVEERTRELHALSEKLQVQVRTLEEHNRETRILGEMSEMLQACLSIDEAQLVVAQHTQRLFQDVSGALYSFGPSKNLLEEMISWNGPLGSSPVFAPNDCWALRRGRSFLVNEASAGIACKHTDHRDGATLCVPLLAQGEAIGLFHLAAHAERTFTSTEQRLAQTIAETVALAFVNLRLRDTLRQQSIRDALTGLFNRRYLEETFDREARRAQRHGTPMGLVMLDVDHFKTFNDTHGHDAGDALLVELGKVLQGALRGEDLVSRYGGEEFTLLLPGANLEQTAQRAEAVRRAVEVMQVHHQGRALGSVTVSMGVTAFPAFGVTLPDLLRQADYALYTAKEQGRNRVVRCT